MYRTADDRQGWTQALADGIWKISLRAAAVWLRV
jgi:hypothetical protein